MLPQLGHTAYDDREQSLFLLLYKQLDGAFAQLRTASDLARDIARMGEDRVNLETWMAKSTVHRKKVSTDISASIRLGESPARGAG